MMDFKEFLENFKNLFFLIFYFHSTKEDKQKIKLLRTNVAD
ncbi:hypothetical protein STRDD13_00344 [Streptococcus sp. DD13]|nr:hypothetical protein STRDD13_00344 [Streptococcus sp. DD13]